MEDFVETMLKSAKETNKKPEVQNVEVDKDKIEELTAELNKKVREGRL